MGSKHPNAIGFACRESLRRDETGGTKTTAFSRWYQVGIEKQVIQKEF